MDGRKHSDGDISPTTTGLPSASNRSSANTPTGYFSPSWDASARSPGLGFSGDMFRMSSNGGLRGAAASFEPTQDNTLGRLRLLSLNTTDDTPTIVTSAPALKHAVQEPIGTKSTNSSPVHPKAWFTTDIDPNKPPMAGHFILVQGIKDSDINTGVVPEIEKMYSEEILGKKTMKVAETGDYADVVLFINDTRAATKIYNDLECEGMLTTSFVSHDWYNAGQGVRSGSIDPKTMYVGQVTFVAEFKGRTAEYDPTLNVYDRVREVAKTFGTISAFEQNNAAQYPLWQFRVEFFKVSAAERAITKACDGIKLEDVPGWIVFANQYIPLTYGNTNVKRSAELNAVQAVAIPNGAEVVMSPTGRTAWYTSSDGVVHPVPPPRPVANVERAVEEATPPWKGKEIAAYEPQQFSAPPFTRRSHENHYSIDSVLNDVQGNEVAVYNKDQRPQDVVISKIYDGQDVRTTVMLRNIPNHWNWRKLKATLDEACLHRYNFMYLRIDFKENKNVGYAFVNFESALDICDFVHTFVGKPWETGHSHFGKQKLVQISYATIQGLDSLIDKFRNSSIMDENIDFRPILFQTPEEKEKEELEASDLYTQGLEVPNVVEVGEKKAFPAPNNRAKKERSTANAGQIGLFSPRTNRNTSDRWYRSQYDRGTPAQIMEDCQQAAFASPAQNMMSPTSSFNYSTPRYPAVYGSMPMQPQMHFMTAPQFMTGPPRAYDPSMPLQGSPMQPMGVPIPPMHPMHAMPPVMGPLLPLRRMSGATSWNSNGSPGPSSSYVKGHHNGNGNGNRC